jgi:hypothetical protein
VLREVDREPASDDVRHGRARFGALETRACRSVELRIVESGVNHRDEPIAHGASKAVGRELRDTPLAVDVLERPTHPLPEAALVRSAVSRFVLAHVRANRGATDGLPGDRYVHVDVPKATAQTQRICDEQRSVGQALAELAEPVAILEAEATTTLRHMLAGDPSPHYFHQTNLHVYDQSNNILQLDWMEAVVSAYEQWMKLPIQSPRFHELGDLAWRTIEAREAGITGTYNNSPRAITLRANRNATIEMTGLSGGALHGGHRVRSVDLIPFLSRSFTVDQALTQ